MVINAGIEKNKNAELTSYAGPRWNLGWIKKRVMKSSD